MPNKKENNILESSKGQLLVYRDNDGSVKLEVRLQDETIWLTINQMAKLFGVDKSGISRHVKNIFESSELLREATVAKFATVQNEGNRNVTRVLEYYYLSEDELKILNHNPVTIKGKKHEDS